MGGGWQRTEQISAGEAALQEHVAVLDRLVHNESTTDATNGRLMTVIRSASLPQLDTSAWMRSTGAKTSQRVAVARTQAEENGSAAHWARTTPMRTLTERIRRLSGALRLATWHNVSNQLNEMARKGEYHAAHVRDGAGDAFPASHARTEERVQPLLQPDSNGVSGGVSSFFFERRSEKVARRASKAVVIDQHTFVRDAQDWRCLRSAVWALRHWKATVPWNMPTELLNDPCLPTWH